MKKSKVKERFVGLDRGPGLSLLEADLAQNAWRAEPRLRGRRQDGFSLTELLVVIAIVAVLAAIIIPAVGRIRLSAQNSTCISNLRQLHMAGMLWVNENNGKMPREKWWIYDFAPYLDMPNPSRWEKGMGSPYCCPATDEQYPSIQNYDWTYAMNKYATSDQTVSVAYQIPKVSMVNHPAELSFIMDGTCGKSGSGVYWRTVNPQNVPPAGSSPLIYAHGDAINVIFVDGHVQQISSSEMMEKYAGTRCASGETFFRRLP